MIERRNSQVSSHHFKTLSLLNPVVCGSDDRVFRSSEPSLLIYPWEKFPWHSTWQSTWQLWQWQWCPDIDCANPWHVLTHRSEEEEDYKNIRFYILIYFIEQSIGVRFLMYLKNTLFLPVRIALILLLNIWSVFSVLWWWDPSDQMCMIIEGSGFTTILTDIETQEMCNYGIKTATILTITHIHISRDSMINLLASSEWKSFIWYQHSSGIHRI